MYIYIAQEMYIIFIAIRRAILGGLDLDAIIGVQLRLDIVHQVQDFKHDLNCRGGKIL